MLQQQILESQEKQAKLRDQKKKIKALVRVSDRRSSVSALASYKSPPPIQ
jgi:hypothetical protein